MLFQLPAALLLVVAAVAEASSHAPGAHVAHLRRRALNPRGEQPLAPVRRSSRRSCKAPGSSSATVVANAGTKPSATSSEAASTTSKSSSGSSGNSDSKPNVARPANWPTATLAGPTPTSTVASSHDPYLEELSKAPNNANVDDFNAVHTGDMTYYGQGLGACGDVYDDQSFTAAVSELMFDAWPGADASAQNRNPICGPFVPGRHALSNAGTFFSAIKSSVPGYAVIGGDGLINCVGTADAKCHIPQTATVKHGDKTIIVEIVDRCVGCEHGDIDLTPAAFAALADPALGRTNVEWWFNPIH